MIESATRCIDRIEGTSTKLQFHVEVTHRSWMEKLVEARKNRQERRPQPYRNFRKPYNGDSPEQKKPQLRNKLQPTQELDVQAIMTAYNCEYDDVVEVVDLYNMDVEESQSM